MRILTFMHCLLKTRIERVTVWVLSLDFSLTGNIHLEATARIAEIDDSQLHSLRKNSKFCHSEARCAEESLFSWV